MANAREAARCAASLLLASIAGFGTSQVLGRDRNFPATEVLLALAGRYSQSEAAVYGVVLLALVGLILVGSRLMLGVKGFTTVTGKPASGAFLRLPRSLEAGLTLLVLVLVCSGLSRRFTGHPLWVFRADLGHPLLPAGRA